MHLWMRVASGVLATAVLAIGISEVRERQYTAAALSFVLSALNFFFVVCR